MTLQSSALRPQIQPINKLLQGSPVLSGEGVRLIVRSYFVSSGFTSELVLGMPRADSVPTSKPGRSQGMEFRPDPTIAKKQARLLLVASEQLRAETVPAAPSAQGFNVTFQRRNLPTSRASWSDTFSRHEPAIGWPERPPSPGVVAAV